MKITTFALYDWDGNLIREESYEYSGPIDRLDRGQAKQVANQGMQQSSQDQANAQTAFGSDMSAINSYQNAVKSFAAKNPYGIGGQFAQDQNTINADTSNAGTNSLNAALARNAQLTGQNAASYAPTAAEASRQASRDLTTTDSQADQQRIQDQANYNAQATQFASLTPAMLDRLYGTSTSGASSNLGPASSAAAQPSGWQVFGGDLAAAAGGVAAGLCPCAGSLIRLADGSSKAVEDLKHGDYLLPQHPDAKPSMVLEAPRAQRVRSFEIRTSGKLVHRGSETHTVALALGGYGFLPELRGSTILVEGGEDVVTEVNDIGERVVFPLKLNGTHVYQADGVWILA